MPEYTKIYSLRDREEMERANDVISDLAYSLVSVNMLNNYIWNLPIADIGGFDFNHRYLFPRCRDYTLIDLSACNIDVSNLQKGTRLIVGEAGFPRLNVKRPDKTVAIALFSLTIDDQYMEPEVIEALSKFRHVYITIPNDRLEAYSLYTEAFHGHLECIYTRNGDHLKLMHYWK